MPLCCPEISMIRPGDKICLFHMKHGTENNTLKSQKKLHPLPVSKVSTHTHQTCCALILRVRQYLVAIIV